MADREIRQVLIEGNAAYVPLTQGYIAIIDASDVPLVNQWNWNALIATDRSGALRTVYAVCNALRSGKADRLLMHRVISQAPDGRYVDHINGDGMDNRRINLRIATQAQNSRNTRLRHDSTSGVKGVMWESSRGKWKAQITVDGVQSTLGRFDTIEDAAACVTVERSRLHGDFARHK